MQKSVQVALRIPIFLILVLVFFHDTAMASLWVVRCAEVKIFGQEHAAQCSKEVFLKRNSPSEPADLRIRTGYEVKDAESVAVTLQFDRIDMPSDGEFLLNVAGIRIDRLTLPQNLSSFSQAPAQGSCRLSVLGTLEPVWQCNASSADTGIGKVQLSLTLNDTETRKRFQLNQQAVPALNLATELREARFTLAAAALSGTWRGMETTSQAPQAPKVLAATELTETNCNTEDQAKQAEALALAGTKDADRLAGVCFSRAAGNEKTERARLWAKAVQWFERAVARGDTQAMVAYAWAIPGMNGVRWDPSKNKFFDLAQAEIEQNNEAQSRLFAQAANAGSGAGQVQMCQHHFFSGRDGCKSAFLFAKEKAQCSAGTFNQPEQATIGRSWCETAHDQGYAKGTAMLALFYEQGVGVPKSLARSRELLFLASERGDKTTSMQLARAYELGMPDSPAGNIPRDIGKAIEFYRRVGTRPDKVAELEAAQTKVGAGVDSTVFGIPVGFQLPNLSSCNFEDKMKQYGQQDIGRLCSDTDVAIFTRMLDRLGLGKQTFTENGLRLLAVKVNDEKMDTALLFAPLGISSSLDVAIDGSRVVHFISVQTKITATNAVLQMLTVKYGKPTRSGSTEWMDTRTGALLRRTPIYYWDLKGLNVTFETQHASDLGNLATSMGQVDIYTPTFAQVLQQYAAKKSAEQPKGKF